MDAKTMALDMLPYWMLGLFVIWATIKSGYGDLLRIDTKAVFNWIRFLGIVTIYRIIAFKLFPNSSLFASAKSVTFIPWYFTLSVFWEDATHSLPLLLLRYLIGTKWYTWPIHIILTAIVMLEFSSGHLYQGLFAAGLLGLYVPYSIRLAKQYGYGTIMIGHTLYDLTTILSIKFLLGT